MRNDWPFIKIASEPDLYNGATIPIKLIAVVTDLPTGGCCIRLVGGHTINLHNVSREAMTTLMEDGVAGRVSSIGGVT